MEFIYFSDEWNEKREKRGKVGGSGVDLQEWVHALRMPSPVKNKKKYTRKTKHRNERTP
jgi:hypothetical protein